MQPFIIRARAGGAALILATRREFLYFFFFSLSLPSLLPYGIPTRCSLPGIDLVGLLWAVSSALHRARGMLFVRPGEQKGRFYYLGAALAVCLINFFFKMKYPAGQVLYSKLLD